MQACSAMLAEMRLGHNFLLDMPFLHGSTKDISSFDRKLTAYGGKVVVGQGASFNGYGDYIAIQNFDYASDGDFSISMWFTKGACNQESPFEYVYSHNEYPTGNQSGIQNTKNSVWPAQALGLRYAFDQHNTKQTPQMVLRRF